MIHKDAYESVNRKGEYWDEQECVPTCYQCGETESFKGMKYNPEDRREMECPKCGNSTHVSNYYSEMEKT